MCAAANFPLSGSYRVSRAHPATAHYGAAFEINDEIYQFKNWDRSKVHVLLSLDPDRVDLKKEHVKRGDRDFALRPGENDAVARYPAYANLPAHIREMLRAVCDGDDGAAERYAHAPNKHLKGRSVMVVVNAWFGQRVVEHFLLDHEHLTAAVLLRVAVTLDALLLQQFGAVQRAERRAAAFGIDVERDDAGGHPAPRIDRTNVVRCPSRTNSAFAGNEVVSRITRWNGCVVIWITISPGSGLVELRITRGGEPD